jgi:hypothetical protein
MDGMIDVRTDNRKKSSELQKIEKIKEIVKVFK